MYDELNWKLGVRSFKTFYRKNNKFLNLKKYVKVYVFLNFLYLTGRLTATFLYLTGRLTATPASRTGEHTVTRILNPVSIFSDISPETKATVLDYFYLFKKVHIYHST